MTLAMGIGIGLLVLVGAGLLIHELMWSDDKSDGFRG